MSAIDHRGIRYGKLVGIAPTGDTNSSNCLLWKFQCDCGNTVIRSGHNVKRSVNQSCGCYKESDLTGKRFGKLVGLEKTGKKTPHGDIVWCFQCDCGNTAEYTVHTVKGGHAISCGCRKLLQPHEIEGSLIRHLWGLKKSHTRRRRKEITWDLTFEEFTKLITSSCVYCGGKDHIERSGGTRVTPLNGEFCGIDRRDSSKGYTPENCDPCCKMCNYAKNKFTQDEFIAWIARTVEHNIDMTWVMKKYNTDKEFRDRMNAGIGKAK